MALSLRDIAVKLIKGELPSGASADLAKARLTECEACPQFQRLSRQCKLCGCFLDLKTKLLEAECPAGKW